MVSISTFFISLAGIVALLSFRMWEIKKGERLCVAFRERLDEWAVRVGTYLRNHIPTLDYASCARLYHTVLHFCALIALGILHIVERRVVRVLEHVRGKRDVQRGVTGSEFLKQVSEHKQSLEKPVQDSIE